ncbi:MAG: MCE family protein [Cryobacterium sp.]|nr:MCE family protein [Oligoflexia bacterium]
MKDTRTRDFKVGIFVTLGVAFSMVAILVLGGAENAFTSKAEYQTHFPTTNGLLSGSKVVLSGVPVGTVAKVDYDAEKKNIQVLFKVDKKYSKYLVDGTTVEIATQGVLGDKYISINPGSGNSVIAEHAEIPNLPGTDMASFLSKSDLVMMNLNSTIESLNRILRSLEKGNRVDTIAENLSTVSKNLASFSSGLEGKGGAKASKSLTDILDKINSGTGTLGALVNDPSLYEDARALVGGANRNRIIRNLVRKTAKDGGQAKDVD